MALSLRRDTAGVASTIATMFALLVALIFLDMVLVDVLPRQEYNAEFVTTQNAIASFQEIRGLAQGPLIPPGPGRPSPAMTFGIPLGTQGVSPLQAPTTGTLTFDPLGGTSSVSLRFVPNFNRGAITRVDQDVVLAIDSSGSMMWNDPQRLRISGAKEYVGQLACPDTVAVVDFDDVARLTLQNKGGPAHHLNSPYNDCFPDFSRVKTDLDTIDSRGGTNFGAALQVSVDELLANGQASHEHIIILLTDGQNNYAWQNDLARQQARRARDNGITVFTIGLGQADVALLQEIADTTGGTFYFASDPSAIRWIYFEISRRFQGAFVCGDLSTSEAGMGRLSLELRNQVYPSQTITYEAGGVVRRQPLGVVLVAGPTLEWHATDPWGKAGVLNLDGVALTGSAFTADGSGIELITVHPQGRDLQNTPITKVNLTDVATSLAQEEQTLDDWTRKGASTPAGTASVEAPLDQAQSALWSAQGRSDVGDYTGAKFFVDSASADVSAAIAAAQQAAQAKTMQRWLADATTNDLLVVACRLVQWANWYEGVTLRVSGSDANAWEAWLNRTATTGRMKYVVSRQGDDVLLTIRCVDRLVLDRRVVSISLNG